MSTKMPVQWQAPADPVRIPIARRPGAIARTLRAMRAKLRRPGAVSRGSVAQDTIRFLHR